MVGVQYPLKLTSVAPQNKEKPLELFKFIWCYGMKNVLHIYITRISMFYALPQNYEHLLEEKK